MFDNVCTLYMSHPILGTNGDMEGNCKKAIAAVKRLRNVFPEVNIYCPAESDLVIQILYNKGVLSVGDILDADLEILRETNGWFFYKFDESSGSVIEQDEAIRQGFCNETKTIFTMDIEKASYDYLRKAFGPVIEAAKRRFRNGK